MAIDKVLSSSIANGAVTAALISNTANLVVSSLTANVITITTISGSANVTGDMTVGGNLTISGTTTYVNTTDLNIGDAIISLNADLAANVSPTEDAGISINRGASTNAQFKWIESTDNWSIGNTTVSGIFNANDTIITGTANVSVGINVGANVNLSTTYIDVGNSTVNTTITNITVSTNTVNVASIINIGANVSANTTALRVGNSTVNTVITSTSLTTTSNTVSIGTAAYFVANGNVGIGTSTVVSGCKLNVLGGINSTNGGLNVAGNGGFYNGANKFGVDNNAGASRLYSSGPDSSTKGSFEFHNTDSVGTLDTIAMTLAANGNLGIGTTSPKAPLHVVASAGAANDKTLIIQDKTAGNAGEAWLSFKAQESLDDERIKGAIVYANGGSAYGVGNLLFCMNSTADNSNATTANEKMRLDSSGNLGINSTSPATYGRLDVNQTTDPGTTPAALSVRLVGVGGGTAVPQYGINVDASQSYNNASIVYGIKVVAAQNVGGTTYGVHSTTNPGNSTTNRWAIYGKANVNADASHSLSTLPVGVYGEAGNTTGTSNVSTSAAGYFLNSSTLGSTAYGVYIKTTAGPTTIVPLRIDHASSELMRINSSGNLALTGTGTVATFSSTATSQISIQAANGGGFNSRIYMECPGVNAGGLGYIRSTSRLYAWSSTEDSGPYVGANGTSWTTNSDARLKTNVQNIGYGLDAVLALLPKKYEYKIDEGKKCLGFIAQDVVAIIPELVDVPEDSSEMMGIEYQAFIPVLVKAIQEQQALIVQLTARITALETA